jgi:hypothetical protein
MQATAVYPLLPFTSAAITALVGLYAYRRRAANAAARPLAGMMLPVTLWTASMGLQRLSQTPAAFLFWVDVSFTAIAFIPVTALFSPCPSPATPPGSPQPAALRCCPSPCSPPSSSGATRRMAGLYSKRKSGW